MLPINVYVLLIVFSFCHLLPYWPTEEESSSKIFFLSYKYDSIYGEQMNELINKRKVGWVEERVV